MKRAGLLAVVCVAGALVGGACNPEQRNALAALGNKPQDDGQAPGPVLGVPDESGTTLDARWARGQVVIVDFWASWCAPCQHSIPFYRKMHERFRGRGLRVVGVNVDDSRDAFLEYAQLHPMPFSLVWDAGKTLSGRFQVFQLPTTFLFDRRGRLRKTRTGFDPTESRAVEDEIRLLLGEPAP